MHAHLGREAKARDAPRSFVCAFASWRLCVNLRRVKRLSILFAAALPVAAQTLPEPAPPITNASQLRFMAPTNAALKHPVKLRAVVTAVDWRRTVFIQDETGGSFFSVRPAGFELQPGDRIEVAGV